MYVCVTKEYFLRNSCEKGFHYTDLMFVLHTTALLVSLTMRKP